MSIIVISVLIGKDRRRVGSRWYAQTSGVPTGGNHGCTGNYGARAPRRPGRPRGGPRRRRLPARADREQASGGDRASPQDLRGLGRGGRRVILGGRG